MTEETKTFTQEEVNDIVGKRLVREREKFAAEQQAATEKAQQDTLTAEAKWQELAGVHEQRVKELEPLEAQVKAYQEMVEGMLKNRIEELGDTAKKAVAELPGSPTDLETLNWLNANAASLEVVVGDGVGTPRRTRDQAMPAKTVKAAKGYRPITI